MWSKREPFHALPFLRHVVPLNIGRWTRGALPHAFVVGMFEYGKSNSTAMKQIYNESEHLN